MVGAHFLLVVEPEAVVPVLEPPADVVLAHVLVQVVVAAVLGVALGQRPEEVFLLELTQLVQVRLAAFVVQLLDGALAEVGVVALLDILVPLEAGVILNFKPNRKIGLKELYYFTIHNTRVIKFINVDLPALVLPINPTRIILLLI